MTVKFEHCTFTPLVNWCTSSSVRWGRLTMQYIDSLVILMSTAEHFPFFLIVFSFSVKKPFYRKIVFVFLFLLSKKILWSIKPFLWSILSVFTQYHCDNNVREKQRLSLNQIELRELHLYTSRGLPLSWIEESPFIQSLAFSSRVHLDGQVLDLCVLKLTCLTDLLFTITRDQLSVTTVGHSCMVCWDRECNVQVCCPFSCKEIFWTACVVN